MTGGELYRTWFGLEGMTPNPLGEKLRRLQILSTHPEPTAAQRKELGQLRGEVRKELVRRLGEAAGHQAFEEFDANGGSTATNSPLPQDPGHRRLASAPLARQAHPPPTTSAESSSRTSAGPATR
jgi:hypothetical protein